MRQSMQMNWHSSLIWEYVCTDLFCIYVWVTNPKLLSYTLTLLPKLQLFYISHIVGYPLYYIFMIFHSKNFWKWFIFPGIVFIIEQVYMLSMKVPLWVIIMINTYITLYSCQCRYSESTITFVGFEPRWKWASFFRQRLLTLFSKDHQASNLIPEIICSLTSHTWAGLNGMLSRLAAHQRIWVTNRNLKPKETLL